MFQKFYVIVFVAFTLLTTGCFDDTRLPKNKPDAAEKKTDPPVQERILVGTTVLRGSVKNSKTGRNHGMWLVNLTAEPCKTQVPYKPEEYINTLVKIRDSILVIGIEVYETCDYSFLGEIEVVNENTLNLIYHGYGNYTDCNCVTGLSYKMKLEPDLKDKWNKIEYFTINGSRRSKLSHR
jgi:hypothetical protein